MKWINSKLHKFRLKSELEPTEFVAIITMTSNRWRMGILRIN